jgi:2-deoxy-D-gluconate 3-dehydrogenase
MPSPASHSQLIDLSGRVAIVTGGAKGIGLGISQRLAEAGAGVLIADLDPVAADRVVAEFTSCGWTAAAHVADVSSEADVAGMMEAVSERFGALDILVNNAGIYPQIPLADMTLGDFQRVLAVNLQSVFLTTTHAVPLMRARGGGRIINVTSIDALHPSMIGLAHCDASKHGTWGFTKNAALEFASDRIWINAIAPGGIATPGVAAMQGGEAPDPQLIEAFAARIPMGRMGEPDDIGKVALFLASDMSSYMTGSQIVVDGGVLLA